MSALLVECVYKHVRTTTPTEQAVLAYLAHRMNHKKCGLCCPSVNTIAGDTRFKASTVHVALNGLYAKGLLVKDEGGYGKAHSTNHYSFHLPVMPDAKEDGLMVVPAERGMLRQPDPDRSVCRTGGTPSAGYNHSFTIQNQQPSLIEGDRKGGCMRMDAEAVGERLIEQASKSGNSGNMRQLELDCLVDDAMTACGEVSANSRRYFYNTMSKRDPGACQEVIQQFARERRSGECDMIHSPARFLVSRLKEEPKIVPKR